MCRSLGIRILVSGITVTLQNTATLEFNFLLRRRRVYQVQTVAVQETGYHNLACGEI